MRGLFTIAVPLLLTIALPVTMSYQLDDSRPKAVSSANRIGHRSDGGGSHYQYDDGGDEGACCVQALDMAWLHRFDAENGADVITRVEAVFGSFVHACGVPNGTPVNVCIWDDPDDDGDPTNAVLLTRVSGVVQNTNILEFNEFEVPPTPVTGTFFVGCYLTTLELECAAGWDTNFSEPGLAWIVANTELGSFDPECLPCNGIGPFDLVELGWPAVWLLRASGTGGCGPGSVYCTAKSNSCAQTPRISSAGLPSASSKDGFHVIVDGARAQKAGLLLYTSSGAGAVPFDGGFLCVLPPISRSVPAHDASGTPGLCDGQLSIDMNAFGQGALGGNPAPFLLVPGTGVYCQWWARDTMGHGSLLSNALEYVVCE